MVLRQLQIDGVRDHRHIYCHPFLHDYRSIAVAGLITELVGGYTVPPIVL